MLLNLWEFEEVCLSLKLCKCVKTWNLLMWRPCLTRMARITLLIHQFHEWPGLGNRTQKIRPSWHHIWCGGLSGEIRIRKKYPFLHIEKNPKRYFISYGDTLSWLKRLARMRHSLISPEKSSGVIRISSMNNMFNKWVGTHLTSWDSIEAMRSKKRQALNPWQNLKSNFILPVPLPNICATPYLRSCVTEPVLASHITRHVPRLLAAKTSPMPKQWFPFSIWRGRLHPSKFHPLDFVEVRWLSNLLREIWTRWAIFKI